MYYYYFNAPPKKKEEEDLPVLDKALTHRYKDLMTTKAWKKTDCSHLNQYWRHEEQQTGNKQKAKERVNNNI